MRRRCQSGLSIGRAMRPEGRAAMAYATAMRSFPHEKTRIPANYGACRIFRARVMETRLMDDGSQLTRPGEAGSSCEAIGASASSEACYSVEFHHSEGIADGYMVKYHSPGTQIRCRFGWQGTRRMMQTPPPDSHGDKHRGTYKS